jgi:hypothetical protein
MDFKGCVGLCEVGLRVFSLGELWPGRGLHLSEPQPPGL